MSCNQNSRRQSPNQVLGTQSPNQNSREQIPNLINDIINNLEDIRDILEGSTTTTTTTNRTTDQPVCRDNEVNRILAQIEKNNPEVMRRLMSFGMSENEARRIIRTIIRLTLKYED